MKKTERFTRKVNGVGNKPQPSPRDPGETVAEQAKRMGISISKVRKMRQGVR